VIAQRFRYFIKKKVPLTTDKDFRKGRYAGLKNDLLPNVQNTKGIDIKTFDQNRLNSAIRLSV